DATTGERRVAPGGLDLRSDDDTDEWRWLDDLPDPATAPGTIPVDRAHSASEASDDWHAPSERGAGAAPAMSTTSAQDANAEPGPASRVMAKSRGAAFDLPDAPSPLHGVPRHPGELRAPGSPDATQSASTDFAPAASNAAAPTGNAPGS